MNQPQSAILPDDCISGIYIEASLKTDLNTYTGADLQLACQKSLALVEKLQKKFPDAVLGLSIAFGADLWKSFNRPTEANELKPFRPLGHGLAPATQHDLFIHIQGMRPDVCYSLAIDVVKFFENIMYFADETHGFRLLENRGLDGFVDGTENPKNEACQRAAIIPEGQADAGGSYVLVQKYLHDLKKWSNSSLHQQETCVGRSKEQDEELDDRALDSHLARVDLVENGESLKIVRRSLPFGSITGEQGLLFIAYCARLHNIEAQLHSMFGETDGKVDLLLTHLSKAISGAYYFAPSTERLKNLFY